MFEAEMGVDKNLLCPACRDRYFLMEGTDYDEQCFDRQEDERQRRIEEEFYRKIAEAKKIYGDELTPELLSEYISGKTQENSEQTQQSEEKQSKSKNKQRVPVKLAYVDSGDPELDRLVRRTEARRHPPMLPNNKNKKRK